MPDTWSHHDHCVYGQKTTIDADRELHVGYYVSVLGKIDYLIVAAELSVASPASVLDEYQSNVAGGIFFVVVSSFVVDDSQHLHDIVWFDFDSAVNEQCAVASVAFETGVYDVLGCQKSYIDVHTAEHFHPHVDHVCVHDLCMYPDKLAFFTFVSSILINFSSNWMSCRPLFEQHAM